MGGADMFVQPLTPYHTFILDFMTMGELKRATGLATTTLKRILRDAPFSVYVFPGRRRSRYLVAKRNAEQIILAHGSAAARAKRRAEYEWRNRMARDMTVCPRCGDERAKRRGGFTSAGNRVLWCHGCRRHFTANGEVKSENCKVKNEVRRRGTQVTEEDGEDNGGDAKVKVQNENCPFCGAVERQWRHGFTSRGLRRYQCGACLKTYTPGRTIRLPYVGRCPGCGETTRHDRGHASAAMNVSVRCCRCGHRYLLVGNPDAAEPPKAEAKVYPVLSIDNSEDFRRPFGWGEW